MAELLVVGFSGRHPADEIVLEALKQNREGLRDLEDAVVVTRDHEGHLRVKPYCDILAATTGHKSQLWGEILTTLFESNDHQSLHKIGIDADTCERIEAMMGPDSSAIFLLVNQVEVVRLRQRLDEFGGQLLYVGLAHDDERQLVEAIRA